MSIYKPFILISSGGTGGHMSPAAALAADLKTRGYRVELATDQRGLKYQTMFGDIPVHLVQSGTAGAGIKGKIKGGLNLLRGLKQAWSLVSKMKPDVVVGFGGYPSFPAVFVAQIRGIPTIIHEQNAILGLANKMLVKRARIVALSHAAPAGAPAKYVVTGNPIRADIAALHDHVYTPPSNYIRVLVMGGSLGATVFSKVVPAAIINLPEQQKQYLKVIQQCRAADIDEVRKIYDEAGIDATLAPFFDHVAEELSLAHLVICRSGASTVAEVSAAGKPAIFVPYPHHKDQQQKRNAQGLADYGGAWIMTEDHFTPKALQDKLRFFFDNMNILPDTAAKARRFAKPDAAHRLGDLVESLLKKG